MARALFSLLAVLALLAACSKAKTVEFADACKAELDGKLIRTTGYLRAPFEALCRSATRQKTVVTTCSFDLRDKADGGGRLSLNIELGTGKNRVDKARLDARHGAAAIEDDDGKYLADGAAVRVTGTLHAMPDVLKPQQAICWLDAETIERR
jgi:hypothetical protein